MPLIDVNGNRNRGLTWEQVFDTPAIITHYAQEQEQQQQTYKYVERTNRKYRKPPVHFSMSLTRIDGDSQKTICRPGSIIEGVVTIKLDTPLAAHHLKIVYKGLGEHVTDLPVLKILTNITEIFYDHSIRISNINNNLAPKKKKGDTFFSIQTTLWGLHKEDNTNEWPILEAGDHQFPFMCEMPMINYPPSIKHSLVSYNFEMIASLERPTIRPFHTIPLLIQYEPFLLSTKVKFPELYQQTLEIDATKLSLCLTKGIGYNLLDSHIIPIQLHIRGNQSNVKLINIALKRKLKVHFGSIQASDITVMSHMEQPNFKCIHAKKNHAIYSIPLSLKSAEMTTTVTEDVSKKTHIEYQLELSAKIKHGFIWLNKSFFSIPIHFGTIAPGEQPPFNLLHYQDPDVVNDLSLSTKPKFIKVPHETQDLLPSYHEDVPPPIYLNQSNNQNTPSHQLNRMRLLIT